MIPSHERVLKALAQAMALDLSSRPDWPPGTPGLLLQRSSPDAPYPVGLLYVAGVGLVKTVGELICRIQGAVRAHEERARKVREN